MLDWLEEIFSEFGDTLKDVLPTSPFQQFIDQMEYSKLAEYVGYINYFFPVGNFITILTAWLGCLSLYYIWVIVLRWMKAVS